MYRSLKMPKKRGCIINLISSVLDSAICGFDSRGVFGVDLGSIQGRFRVD